MIERKRLFKQLLGSLTAFTLLGTSAVVLADEVANAPCSHANYRSFDFWLGEWDVYAQGKLAGHNTIQAIQNGCAIAENWRSAGGGSGQSFNAFDAQTGNWNQFWVDSNGLVLRLVGDAKPGVMSMLGLVPIEGEDKLLMRHRITWTANTDGTVRQEWVSARSDTEAWQTIFDGLYVRAGSPIPAVAAPQGKPSGPVQ